MLDKPDGTQELLLPWRVALGNWVHHVSRYQIPDEGVRLRSNPRCRASGRSRPGEREEIARRSGTVEVGRHCRPVGGHADVGRGKQRTVFGGDRSSHKRESRCEHRRARCTDRRETNPGRCKAEPAPRSARLKRVQSLADGLRGQREEDRIGEPAEYQEPAGLPEQPAKGKPVERIEDKSAWKRVPVLSRTRKSAMAEAAMPRRAGGPSPHSRWEPGQCQKAEGRHRQEEFRIRSGNLRYALAYGSSSANFQPQLLFSQKLRKGGAALGPDPARRIGER